MKSLKYNIVTLGNGFKYFVYDEINEKQGRYYLILNVDEEDDVDIAFEKTTNDKTFLLEVDDENERKLIISKFKENNKEEIM